MSGAQRRAVRWIAREPPLEPGAVFASGAAARDVLRSLARRPADALAELRGISSADVLLLLGPSRALPWAEGVEYLGVEPRTRGLWLPTQQRPDVPVDLFERAVRARVGCPDGPIAVLPERGRVLPIPTGWRVDRIWIERAQTR